MTDSDIEELAVIGCLAAASAATYSFLLLKRTHENNRKLARRKRKYCETSSTQILRNELKLHNRLEYRSKLRMNEECYKQILEYIRPKLTKQTTVMKDPIPVDDILSAVLKFMAYGESYTKLRNETGISKALLSNSMPKYCEAIYDTMRNDYLKFPDSITEWENIAENYLRKWKFPLCLGSLDAKDIKIKTYKDYKLNKSCSGIVLLALADADCNFIFIDIGYPGSAGKAGVFNQSDLRKIIDSGENYFPPNKIMGSFKSMPYGVIANDEFPSRKHLLTPFPYSKEYVKRIFNIRINHAMRTIDHSFKTLTNRFAVLQTTINLRPDKVKKIVQASCVLHNFLNQHNKSYIDPLDSNKINTINPEYKKFMGINLEPCFTDIKNNFAKYFSGE